jgi:hypothetical protein
MSDELNTLELKDFLELVDGILEGIESGVIKANPLAPLKDIPHIDSINKKEEEVELSESLDSSEEEEEKEEPAVTNNLLGPISKGDIFGKVMDPERVVIITGPEGVPMYFGNYSSAAKAMGVGPAKAKRLSDNGLTDDSLNVWSLISIL